MTYDLFVPPCLLRVQTWFAQAITNPLIDQQHSNPITVNGEALSIEAAQYIADGPKLLAHQRLEIYNQQYWWRLFKQLQASFPLVSSLFGHNDFNEIFANPYLSAHPPQGWFLNDICRQFCQWVNENYCDTDLPLISRCAHFDYAFENAFHAKEMPSISSYKGKGKSNNRLLQIPLNLQPHMTLLNAPYDLCLFREEILKKGPEYWLNNHFPTLNKERDFFFVVYRNSNHNCCWEELSEGEYLFLSLIDNRSIKSCCEWIEKEEISINSIGLNLDVWMQKWISNNWLTPSS
ncbi:MAG: putative DNA-binding domain-containing protein [Parachlamydiales bacterium]|nr:putative DNA-binding domain-containing protein [Parachlamydiales bacterium]